MSHHPDTQSSSLPSSIKNDYAVDNDNDKDADDDTDAILAELEAETSDPNSTAYQQRIKELQQQQQSGTSQSPAQGTNLTATSKSTSYHTLHSDADALQFTTEHAKAVLHFRHPDFGRCAIMDEHLERIALRHGTGEAAGEDLAFARVDVARAPFVVEKLGVRVLPCVIGFVGGVAKGRVVGFEGVCWDGEREGDGRVMRALEGKLVEWGLLKNSERRVGDDDEDEDEERDDGGGGGRRGMGAGQQRRGIKGPRRRNVGSGGDDDDYDDDWD